MSFVCSFRLVPVSFRSLQRVHMCSATDFLPLLCIEQMDFEAFNLHCKWKVFWWSKCFPFTVELFNHFLLYTNTHEKNKTSNSLPIYLVHFCIKLHNIFEVGAMCIHITSNAIAFIFHTETHLFNNSKKLSDTRKKELTKLEWKVTPLSIGKGSRLNLLLLLFRYIKNCLFGS